MGNEIKTGLFILLSIAILIVFTLVLGNFQGIEKTYEIKVVFNWISGLEAHAPVRLRGVEVGEVKDVTIQYEGDDTKIVLTLLVKERVKIREGTKAYVSMLGMMGEKYVELTGGAKGAPFLKPNAIVIGEDPAMIEELIGIATSVAHEIELTASDIRSLVQHLDKLVVENRGDIDYMIDKFKATAVNFEEFSDNIKRNPWKLLVRGKEKTEDKKSSSRRSSRKNF